MSCASPLPIGVLISGTGTNLQNLLERCDDHRLDATVRVVVSNREAPGCAFSRQRDIPTVVLPRSDFAGREAQQQAIADVLEGHGVQLVVLAGFDQILNPSFVQRFHHRIVNLHPSLLPAFGKGMHAVRDALEWGVKTTGCTVHLATEDLDGGPIILQQAVPVEEDDTEESLLARVHEAEYEILPAAIQLFAEDRLRTDGRRVRILPASDQASAVSDDQPAND